MWWSPAEVVAAGAVEFASELAVRADTVGGACGERFTVDHGLRFSRLEHSRFAVGAASATTVDRGICGWCTFFARFHKLEGVSESTFIGCLSSFVDRNDDAITGACKQDDAEGCVAAGAFFDEIAVGCEANFVLGAPF